MVSATLQRTNAKKYFVFKKISKSPELFCAIFLLAGGMTKVLLHSNRV